MDVMDVLAAVGNQPAHPQAEPVATAGAQEPDVAPAKTKATKKTTVAHNAPEGKKAARGKDDGPRKGRKTGVIAMLQR